MILDIGPDQIFHYINVGGTVAVLVFIILTGTKKLWVFGWQYKDLEERYSKVEESNTMWMQLALRGLNVTQQVVEKTVAEDASK